MNKYNPYKVIYKKISCANRTAQLARREAAEELGNDYCDNNGVYDNIEYRRKMELIHIYNWAVLRNMPMDHVMDIFPELEV